MKELDRIYIAQYYEKLGLSEIAKSFYTTKAYIQKEITEMKETGVYNTYKNLSEEEWLKLENKTNKYIKEKYSKEAIAIENNKKAKCELLNLFKVPTMKEIIKSFPIYESVKEDLYINYMQKEGYLGEKWKQIPGFNYKISNYGRIKNTTTNKLKKLKFQAYGMQVILWKDSKGYTITISRLVADMFIKPLEKNERTLHIDGNIRNNYYKNLKIVSK